MFLFDLRPYLSSVTCFTCVFPHCWQVKQFRNGAASLWLSHSWEHTMSLNWEKLSLSWTRRVVFLPCRCPADCLLPCLLVRNLIDFTRYFKALGWLVASKSLKEVLTFSSVVLQIVTLRLFKSFVLLAQSRRAACSWETGAVTAIRPAPPVECFHASQSGILCPTAFH